MAHEMDCLESREMFGDFVANAIWTVESQKELNSRLRSILLRDLRIAEGLNEETDVGWEFFKHLVRRYNFWVSFERISRIGERV
jgi:hypothetical protein